VKNFYDRIDKAPKKQRVFYPEAHHHLMYDLQRQEVVSNIASWLAALQPPLCSDKE
jgi:esterase/lipase